MRKIIKYLPLLLLSVATVLSTDCFAQTKSKKELSKKRQAVRNEMHSRDSLLRSLNQSDTSINSLLQRVEQYTTTFNQIKNNLSEGLDTIDVSEQLPLVIKRIDKIINLANTHKSSTLRYLFVLRDNLNHIRDELDGWQSDLQDVDTTLVQNQNDLLKFNKDTLMKTIPADSLVRETFFAQRKVVRELWNKTDSTNRSNLLKVNLLQDKIAVSYTKILDESDQIESKIRRFALKAVSGESGYIWSADPQYDDFKTALKNTLRLNQLLFNYFIKSETVTHGIALLFLVMVFTWILYSRSRVLRDTDAPETIFGEANYICKKPFISSFLVVTTIIPYFYDHPPAVFLETLFLISIALALVLVKNDVPKITYNFLILLLSLDIAYGISNLFIEIANVDRYVIFILSIISIITSFIFYKKAKANPENDLPNTGLALKIFAGFQVVSLLLNMTGRFSLAKIIGVTSVFNLWMLVVLYLVVRIIVQSLYLQFKIKRGSNSIINWVDYELVQKKFKKALVIAASLLWLFFLSQNLNIEDWASDNITSILKQPQTIGGATFTFGGFVIFIFVIWLSSLVSKLISYFYDVSAQRVTDLSVQRKKNRSSALIIRMAVFSAGFLLAVAASNFPLDKLTIIISAFGVGIGFGLQNIVNNLVSGLILAFEKPINIGDVIQVDGHIGTMKEIGIRSSKVATGDGSEVIIPNGDLISHQVINWTLSNNNRQIELRIVTAYGVDISKVKDLFKSVLSDRDDIMSNPAPAVFVNNISETAVEFKVLFWEADISTTGSLKSQVLSEIYQAISNESVQLPSTQKDIYLHFPDGIPLEEAGKIQLTEKDKTAEEDNVKGSPLAGDR